MLGRLVLAVGRLRPSSLAAEFPMIPRSHPPKAPVISIRLEKHVRTVLAVALALAAGLATGCSSASTSTDPSPVKCQVSLDPAASSVDPAGASGSVTVTAQPECTWTASADAPWITITSTPPSGQGSGKVDYRAAANTGTAARHGNIAVNGQRAGLDQGGLGCTFSLGQTSLTMDAAGGQGGVAVSGASGCPWTATSNAAWITITAGSSGTGSGSVAFTIAANPGTSRTGTMTIAGQTFTVTERGASDCTFSLSPGALNVAPAGGSGTVSVSTGSRCAWTATSNASWITITSGASGTGNGTVGFTVAASSGPRSGTITIGDQTFTVNQGTGACSYTINPASQSTGQSGGGLFVEVLTDQACPWTASSNAPWITIVDGASGTGHGNVHFNVGSNTGPPRTGTLTIAGQTETISQLNACDFVLSPTGNPSAPGSGGAFSVSVSPSDPSCTGAWSATVDPAFTSWIHITSGSNYAGAQTVQYTVDSTSGPVRTGTMTIAGHSFAVTQGGGCTYSINPPSEPMTAAGGSANPAVTVSAGGGCGWTASSNVGWITGVNPGSGSGPGSVTFTVAANTGPARSGTLTIASQTFTVQQDGGCAPSVTPSTETIGSGGGSANPPVTVNAVGGCSWTASSNVAWITNVSPASGSGPGSVTFTVAANTGAQRVGTLTIAGHTVTVTQASGCAPSITPSSETIASGGGPASPPVTVNAAGGCSWTASSNVAWITNVSPASGTGQGSVTFSVAANTGPERSGTLTIAGMTFTVTQRSGCTYAIDRSTLTIGRDGGAGPPVNISTGAGCTWTATSNVPWINGVTPASGTGPGTVRFMVDGIHPPPPSGRVGTLTIAGQTFTVTQTFP
jgi:hypothetical protein